jgi:hypothetical protein
LDGSTLISSASNCPSLLPIVLPAQGIQPREEKRSNERKLIIHSYYYTYQSIVTYHIHQSLKNTGHFDKAVVLKTTLLKYQGVMLHYGIIGGVNILRPPTHLRSSSLMMG